MFGLFLLGEAHLAKAKPSKEKTTCYAGGESALAYSKKPPVI